jgi:hypothetical protein
MNFYVLKDDITENELMVARKNFLIKETRRLFDLAQKEKDKGNTEKFNKHYNKFREYKIELEELKEAM